MTSLIAGEAFTHATTALRSFFFARGFREVHTQNRLSILAACEDPTTLASYHYNGQVWLLPQTGQMWLEYELLKNPTVPGFFCLSTSYRQERNPVAGRHETIFPMFEFECPGDLSTLEVLLRELVTELGLSDGKNILSKDYAEWCGLYDVDELGHYEEEAMATRWPGQPCFIKNFPNATSPFWNMLQNGDGTAAKIDVILAGQETIGSAARSCSPQEMRHMFHSISDGDYAKLLFDTFGQARVEAEMKEFLALDFFPRVGGGIGLTRLLRALDLGGAMPEATRTAA